jgi:membrane protein
MYFNLTATRTCVKKHETHRYSERVDSLDGRLPVGRDEVMPYVETDPADTDPDPSADGPSDRSPGTGAVDVETPVEMPAEGWKDVGRRVVSRMKAENAVLLAAGVAFFAVFAVFPALVALISIYGLVADPQDVARQIDELAAGVPEETKAFLDEQLTRIVTTSEAGLGLALVLSVAVALWSASSGVGHLMDSVNAAYGETSAGFVRARAKALAVALGGVVALAVLFGALTVAPPLARSVNGTLGVLVSFLRWPVIAIVMMVMLAVFYRVAPNRDDARLRWVSPGGLVATVMWLIASAGLAVYAAVVADFGGTYGSFGGVLVLMLWLLLSALSILVGAYVNAEAEHQTVRDTTTGPAQPMGERGAEVADTPPPQEPPSPGSLRTRRIE